jgi:UPF0755 protein
MNDLDIGLPFNDTEEIPRSRVARHRRRRQRGRDRSRTFIAFLVMVLVFGLLGGGAYYGYGKVKDFFTAEDYAGNGTGQVVIQVEEGDTATDIANTLFKAGVVKSAKAFTNAAGDNPDSQSLQPGTYTLRKEMKASAALLLMLDPKSKSVKQFLIKEGLTVKEILPAIAKQTGIPLADFEAAAKDPAALGVPDWARPEAGKPPILEGFLFPAKYEVAKNDNAKTILTAMVAQTLNVMEEDGFLQAADNLNLTPLELLTVASLVEQEGIAADFAKVARVVYNRIKQDMRLQFDSTTQYWLIQTGKGRKKILTNNELRDPNNNYSTTVNKGLPPTPISNPGKAAVDAAAKPEDGKWLYFVVTGKDGSSSFTDSLDVHEQNIEKCRAIGRC